jgi:drug/metabolite transporter (DMT)-like permease
VGYSCFTYLLAHAPATRVSLYNYIQPFAATLFAWMLLGEHVAASVALGGLLVFAGVWLSASARARRVA